jgi:hypothetical protein
MASNPSVLFGNHEKEDLLVYNSKLNIIFNYKTDTTVRALGRYTENRHLTSVHLERNFILIYTEKHVLYWVPI